MERRRQLGQQNLEETIKSLKLPGQAKGGLQKFLEPSKIKDPMYHGTTADIREFKPDRAGATYLTSDPNFASKFALNDMLYGSGLEDQSGFINPGANIMKVHVQATNPFDFDNPKHVRAVLSNLDDRDKKAFRKIIKNKTGDNWRGLENFMHIIEDTGFDSAYLREMGRKNLAVFDPRKIKSAIGNRGTYDTSNPDITKAKGGSIPSMDTMRYELMNRKPMHLAIGGQGPRNWLKGSVEAVVDPLTFKSYTPEEEQWLEGQNEAYRREVRANRPHGAHIEAINKWINSNLANYVRKQMATPNDPIRKLAEQGITHVSAERIEPNSHKANDVRKELGGEKLAKSEEAQAWEDATDALMGHVKIKNIGSWSDEYKEPWHEKVDPETSLFYVGRDIDDHYLGFDHIVDILKQDLQEGRIRPEQLNKMSIEQAVRRTYEYDQERKKKMAETALKSTEGMPVHKDYGDGFKWIELAMPKELPEGHTERMGVIHDPEGTVVGRSESVNDPRYKKLEEALKYEGDTMGHCVGGYCPDVAAGRTRIFSLRDAKNEPHVTIEVAPPEADIRGADAQAYSDAWEEATKKFGSEENNYEQFMQYVDDKLKDHVKDRPPAIKQIKGKQNAKPKKAYIPYVQDFVKSGNWEHVSDLQNAELKTLDQAFPAYEVAKSFANINPNAKYVTQAEGDTYLLNEFGKHRIKPDPESKKTLGRKELMTVRELAELEFPKDLQKQANMIRGALQGKTEPGAYMGSVYPPIEKNKAKGGRVTHAHHLDIEERML